MSWQLSLFDPEGSPTWDDVQEGMARFVPHERYSVPCRDSCMWAESVHYRAGEQTCYLFSKPIKDGMCPSSGRLEWCES